MHRSVPELICAVGVLLLLGGQGWAKDAFVLDGELEIQTIEPGVFLVVHRSDVTGPDVTR